MLVLGRFFGCGRLELGIRLIIRLGCLRMLLCLVILIVLVLLPVLLKLVLLPLIQ